MILRRQIAPQRLFSSLKSNAIDKRLIKVFCFVFADPRKSNGFQPLESPYFCVGQQKNKKTEPHKRTC